MLEHIARLDNGGRVDRNVSFVDVTDNAFFVYQERGSISETLFLVEDAVIFDDCAFEIAEERKSNSKLLGKFTVGGNAVNTETKNLSVG